jgi:hypothetical protein
MTVASPVAEVDALAIEGVMFCIAVDEINAVPPGLLCSLQDRYCENRGSGAPPRHRV